MGPRDEMSDRAADLRGRTAIITGANQGLGRAIAAEYVRGGADLLLVARTEQLLRETHAELTTQIVHADQRIAYLVGDVGDMGNCEAIVAAAREALGDITILVNNAGIYGPMGRTEEVDWDEWLEAFRINLFGTMQMCRAVIPRMRARGYGKIINLSGGGATAPLPFISAYAGAKAAVVRLTETLAEELREACVDVNAIAPGALNTRMLDQVLDAGPEKVGGAFYRRAVAQQEQGGASLDKGAALAAFLGSGASDGLTGRLISAVWDGWADFPQRLAEIQGSDIYTLRRIVPQDRGKDWDR